MQNTGRGIDDIMSFDIEESVPSRRQRIIVGPRISPTKFPGVNTWTITPTSVGFEIPMVDIMNTYGNILREKLRQMPGDMKFKTWLSIELQYQVKKVVDGHDIFTPLKLYFNDNTSVYSESDIVSFMINLQQKTAGPDTIIEHSSSPDAVGSNWLFQRIVSARVGTSSFKPRTARGYKPLPPNIANKKACINVKNNDDKCFMWSVLAFLHPPQRDADRVSKYQAYENELDFSGIPFPVKLSDIDKFERQNNISVNVYEVVSKNVVIGRISKNKLEKHVNLLIHDKHYVWVKSLSRLINSENGTHMHICERCLTGFRDPEHLARHAEGCAIFDAVRVEMPKPDRATIELDAKPEHTMRCPIAIYADFESQLVPVNEEYGSGSEHVDVHRAISYGFTVVSDVDGSTMDGLLETFVGENAADQFVKRLNELYPELYADWTRNIPMVMTRKDEERFQKAEKCYRCKKELGEDRVRHHNHATGEFIGACHSSCNLQIKMCSNKIPVVFHNGIGYDFHHILDAMSRVGDKYETGIQAVPNNTENFKTVSFSGFRFIDSCAFLSAPLETLARNMIDGNPKNAPRFKSHFKKIMSRADMLRFSRKGVYPYKWAVLERFSDTQLPPIEAFRNDLTDAECSNDDYEQAVWVWNKLGCTTFKDYHDGYLVGDVLLLADVFERFRELAHEDYQLDPMHFITLPSFAWSALRVMAGDEGFEDIDLITDPDMYAFFEGAIRGGVSQITTRHARANNPYVPGYDNSKPNTWLSYQDANNLYGLSMVQYLPTHDFQWDEDMTIEDVLAGDWEGENGCFAEVDMKYPEHLHDHHNDLPLAPEKVTLGEADASPFCKELADTLETPITACEKLAGHFRDRIKYKLDARALQLYVKHGMVVTKLHRAIRCKQQAIMKPWIDFNTEKRANAKNDFEKDFYKLMNNSCFGKTMENVRARSNFKFATTDVQRAKYTARATFKRLVPVGDEVETNLMGVDMKMDKVVLDKPIFMGAAILDLSKRHMFEYHYEMMKPRYGDKIKLMFTDTDSLCYHIETPDIYKDMSEMREHLDLSGFPKDHPLYDATNKKVLGKFKDECADGEFAVMTEFVGLRPKVYTYEKVLVDTELADRHGTTKQKSTCKGVKKYVIKRDLNMELYKTVLGGAVHCVKQTCIQSRNQKIHTNSISKIGLSPIDTKRWICDDGINTLAHGHFRAG